MKIQNIDSQSVTDILNEIQTIKNNASISDKFIELELENTDGDETEAINLVTALNDETIVDAVIKCKGDIKLPGTLLALVGRPGFRKSNSKATFELISSKVQNKELINEIILNCSAHPKLLKTHFADKEAKQILSAKEAVDLGIIDEIETFHFKHKVTKRRKSTKQKEATTA